MDVDSAISIKDIFSYLQTPMGRLAVQGFMVFSVSEFVFRGIMKQWLGILMKMKDRKKEKVYIDMIAFGMNIFLGIGVGWFIFVGEGLRSIISHTWWIVVFSVIFHVIYVRYLDKVIKKKYGIK